MVSKHNGIIFLLISLVFLSSCKQKKYANKAHHASIKEQLSFNFPVRLKYAKWFTVKNYNNFKEVSILDRISSDTIANYILALPNALIPDSITSRGTIISVPSKNIICMSSSHIGALEILDIKEKLVGVNGNYLFDSVLQYRLKKGYIKNIGNGSNIDTEQIASISPSILMINSMSKPIPKGKFDKLGTRIIYNEEWRESSLLGRAEWLKMVALFFCKNREADSLFNDIEIRYKNAKTLAKKAKNKPKILYGHEFKGVWYVPEEQSYIASAFIDANAYFRPSGKGKGSLPLSFETVYANYYDADCWLTMHSTAKTLGDLENTNGRYAAFKSFKTGNVFSNNKRYSTTGGNDYWTSGIYNPDILLKDYIKMLHPNLLSDYELVYWQKLGK